MDDITQPQQPIIALAENLIQAQLAAEPSTDSELLRELASSTDQKTREAVVGNSNTPDDVLLKLGAEFPSQLLDNPVFPLLLLENPNLVAEIPFPTLQSILRQENVPVYILEQAANKADLEVQLALVKNVQTPQSVLSRLTQSQHPQVVESARLHINLAGELTEGYEQKIREVIQGTIPPAYNVDIHSLTVLAQICPIQEFIVEVWVQEPSYQNFLCRAIAYSPATSPSILEHLANHTAQTRCAVAQNPNTPPETLRKLASDEGCRVHLARNPSTPSEVLESLSKDTWIPIRVDVAENPNTSPTVLKDLAKDKDIQVALAAARITGELQGEYNISDIRDNPNIPAKVLFQLAEEAPWAVLKHPNTPSELLLKFSTSPIGNLRQDIAANPNTPVSILEQLAHDECSYVRCEVANNRNTPISILFKQLARDALVSHAVAYQISTEQRDCFEVEHILDILAEESSSPLETILQRLGRDGGETARVFLASRFDLPTDLLVQLAEAIEVKVREAVAKNLSTPSRCLEQLVKSQETKVRQAVAQNPNTPINVLEKLAKDVDSTVRMHIAEKTNLSPETLEELAGDESNIVREKAMLNPSLAKEAVERILYGEYATNYLELNPDFLERHPDSKALVINHYAKSSSPLVSFIALNQPKISQELLQEKSVSIFWLERLAVAQNPHSARKILVKLAEDSNQLVRAAAKNTLQYLS
jgi:Leucine rich repeat variant